MNCPFCNASDTKVTDSRLSNDGLKIRRRRKCLKCEKRFSTYETIEYSMPMIIKNDGRREDFRRDKLIEGMKKACQKRPVSANQIEIIAEQIEKSIRDLSLKELPSRDIGRFVMPHLKSLDTVAYVRFASVYKTFKDIEEFVTNLREE